MGLLSSIVSLLFVAGAGWFTIYYLIPKIESGELGGIPSTKGGSEGSGGEVGLVESEMMDAITGEESGTFEAITPVEEEEEEAQTKVGKGKRRGGGGGKKEGKGKKKKTQIEIIMESYGYRNGSY